MCFPEENGVSVTVCDLYKGRDVHEEGPGEGLASNWGSHVQALVKSKCSSLCLHALQSVSAAVTALVYSSKALREVHFVDMDMDTDTGLRSRAQQAQASRRDWQRGGAWLWW